MSVTPASSTSPAASSSSSSSSDMSKLSGNFNTFLTLLTSQLKNQDPTSPMDSNQFTQQLVMYSQVEQQIQSNDNLKTLISQGNSNAVAVTAGYLGKRVSVANGMASLGDGKAVWSYNLDGAAASSTVTITNASGKIVYTGDAEKTAGDHAYTWDGKDNAGNTMPDGAYTLSVTASDMAGAKVNAYVASAGVVSQIDMTGKTPKLIVGNMAIGIEDVIAVAN